MIGGEVGEEGIEVAARENVTPLTEKVIDTFSGCKIPEEDRAIGVVEGVFDIMDGSAISESSLVGQMNLLPPS